MDLLKPKEITLRDIDGENRVYTISRMPFMAGREVGFQYIPSALPKVGDYKVNEAMMQKMMEHVAVSINGVLTRLSTKALIDNHIPDLGTGLALEWHMMEYNASFFHKGTISDFFAGVVRTSLARISDILTQSQVPSSPQSSQPSTNLEPSTT